MPRLFQFPTDEAVFLLGCEDSSIYITCRRVMVRMDLVNDETVTELALPDHSWFLGVQKVTMRSEYTGQSGTEWALISHIL